MSSQVYTHYPGDCNQYPLGTPDEYPLCNQDFINYNEGQIITTSRAKNHTTPLITTSGTLVCKTINGSKTGFTDTYNFRMLANPIDNTTKKLVRYTDTRSSYFGGVLRWQANTPNWAGLHMFARYQTEDDLYVASWRIDGNVTIKKKINGVYTTLYSTNFGAPKVGSEHLMVFEVSGTQLSYFIDGKLVAQVKDDTSSGLRLTWGTNGIRTDYSDNYIKYYKVEGV